MASRLVGLVGLADVLWRDFQQSPSRRPKQRERLQWPYPRHLLCTLRGKGYMKAADGGGNGVRAASKAWEQAHRHLCVEVCPRGQLCRTGCPSQILACRELSEVQVAVQRLAWN